jgi:hypothetical protein
LPALSTGKGKRSGENGGVPALSAGKKMVGIFLLVIFWREGQKCRTSNIFAGKELVQFYVRGVGGKGKRERRRFFYRSYVGISTRYQQYFCW